MVETALANRPNDMPLSLEEIKTYICPNADQTEAMIFLKFCQGQGLNPFLKDVYLIKYDRNKPASIVIGIQALLKRASGNPHYQGYQSGVVVVTAAGEMVEREGSLTVSTDTLVGGWAVIRRDDWPEPLKVTVSLKEYDRHQAQWTEKPGTMIEKCAVGQGHRRAFPGEVGRLYEDAGLAVEVGDVEEASAVVDLPSELTESAAVADNEVPSAARDSDAPHGFDGIRRTCPTHGEGWHPEKKAGWGGFHPVPNGPICSQKTLLTELINQAATDAGKTMKDVNDWLKEQQYGSQTLSGLNVDEKCNVYDRIRGVTVDAPPGENEQGPPLTEEPPVEDAGLAVDETGALAKLDNPGDLLNAAKDRFGRTNEEVCAALNVTEPGLITDLAKAWGELEKLWGE